MKLQWKYYLLSWNTTRCGVQRAHQLLLLRRNSERKNRLSLLEDSARCSREFNHAARINLLALGLKKMRCHCSRARVSLLCKCYSHIERKCATLTVKGLVFSLITCYPKRTIVRGGQKTIHPLYNTPLAVAKHSQAHQDGVYSRLRRVSTRTVPAIEYPDGI